LSDQLITCSDELRYSYFIRFSSCMRMQGQGSTAAEDSELDAADDDDDGMEEVSDDEDADEVSGVSVEGAALLSVKLAA
jgi:hypothetical protein